MNDRKPIPGGNGSAQWIPAEALLKAGGNTGRLVAGFTTALPRLADSDLAPRVARLIPGSGEPAREPLLLAQVHSTNILETDILESDIPESGITKGATPRTGYDVEGKSVHHFDGAMASAEHPRWLGVKTADCVPLLAVAMNVKGAEGTPGENEPTAFAALHVGWRGAAAGIVEKLLRRWAERGLPSGGVRMVLGPHIGGCCYEVGDDCLEAFHPVHLTHAVTTPNGKPHLDLGAVIREQARRLGVDESNVTGLPWCTRCHRPEIPQPEVISPEVQHHRSSPYMFASYRAAVAHDQPLNITNVAVIGYR